MALTIRMLKLGKVVNPWIRSLMDDAYFHGRQVIGVTKPLRNTQHFCSNFFRGLGQNQHGHLCALLPLLPDASDASDAER